ncbi:MAG: N-acetylmuramoyl-L-alanine amidase [Chloroflexi bacterium]|nr:N-acetylmuramoyl-L-alanine amidase [Chloroflexota bacterium]
MRRWTTVISALFALILVCYPSLAVAAPSPDPRFFAQTGYRVDQDTFWDFFQKRGGVQTFGYPVSNSFVLQGLRVQMFQRLVMQQRADGGVQTLNLLDSGYLPYTQLNGSTFPAADPALTSTAPHPDAPDYLDAVNRFVRANAPDTFDGHTVNFAQTFYNTVRAADAFPNGAPPNADALLQGFDLEMWGLPTSRPSYDPHNHNFIYQRFQRGIMHYDATCNCSRALLLADYFKSLLLDQKLPADLAGAAHSSPFLGQWAPGRPSSMARPSELAGTDLGNAFTDPAAPGASAPTPAKQSSARSPIVTLDPGHGGNQIGTSHVFPDGTILQEKALTLRVASKLHELLQQAGYTVFQTRSTDASANPDNKDLTGDGGATLADDLQARIDLANDNHSDVFVSVHFDGVADPNVKGSYIFYDPNRPFSDKSLALAQAMSSALQQSLRAAGYTTDNHGATPDTAVLDGDHYYLLGPQSSTVVRASAMPAVICEGLFLTNDQDATALLKDQVVNAIAQGYLNGIQAYFAQHPPG